MNPLLNLKSVMFDNILNELGKNNIKISEINDSAKAHMIYGLTVRGKNSSLICCANVFEAKKMVQNLKFFSDILVDYFPAKEILYYDIDAESKDIEAERISVINNIFKNNDKRIIVTTIDALMTKIPSLDNVKEKFEIELNLNSDIAFEKLVADLASMGYERCENVEGMAQFSVKGGIIDVFPVAAQLPVRIEFFGDDIDNIRTFDVESQRSIDTLKSVCIPYAKENDISKTRIDVTIENVKKLLEDPNTDENLIDYLKQDLEKLESGEIEGIVYKYYNLLFDRQATIFDYLKDYNIVINEPAKCLEKSNNLCYENLESIKILKEKGYIYEPYIAKYLTYEEVFESVNNKVVLQNLNTSINNDKSFYKEYILDFKEQIFTKSIFETLMFDIGKHKDYLKILVLPTKIRTEQVTNYLTDNGVNAVIVNDIFEVDISDKNRVFVLNGILSEGYSSDNLKLYILAEPLINTKSKIKRTRKSEFIGEKINSYYDLEVGDYIVHEAHGIGIYKGIETISVQGIRKDYIKLEYDKGGTLYIPINQLDSVKKYVCDDNEKVKLNSLNSKEWEKTKRKVTEHVEEVAKELVALYAKRENSKGYAFDKDTQWQKEFEDSFEYELTVDQKQAVKDIKKDMESDKIMDRLLCGDVGYGKTEVALRAAFKAVMSGKQVAYLVPTTVLSLQQYQTFKSRMEPFGIKVEMLSRFRSKKEQTKILKELIDGKIDVVVGTHRLLSKDVFFKDLGFLIIDEEHRFGVKAKESIKILKQNIDVLSMTATPIPRTLHMSLVGIRKMSTLTEPPLERLPVHTYVMEYDDIVIKDAIEKELLRDGQVFYISNRVDNIEEVTQKVREMVPSAKVAFAHGQMDSEEMEEIMLKFMNHEIDIIVCTTILETGIDIKNANTIIIENADKLGLAQLYQIRGRVGRSSRLAYAYITYEKNRQITEVSEKRLKAIKDFTEFGSGFKIALRDLEIRGAGNLLGNKQHGHMVKVGYEMYMSLLEKAVEKEQGKDNTNSNSVVDISNKVMSEVKIDLNVSAYIDDSYIKDPIQKILMYQKISDIKTKEDSLDVIDELLDRYGDIPKETENLIKIVEIRNIARDIGVKKICANGEILTIETINEKFRLTNKKTSDILIYVQLQLNNLKAKLNEKE